MVGPRQERPRRASDADRGIRLPVAEGPMGPEQGKGWPFAEGPMGPEQGKGWP
jgi:hypothetical protein